MYVNRRCLSAMLHKRYSIIMQYTMCTYLYTIDRCNYNNPNKYTNILYIHTYICKYDHGEHGIFFLQKSILYTRVSERKEIKKPAFSPCAFMKLKLYAKENIVYTQTHVKLMLHFTKKKYIYLYIHTYSRRTEKKNNYEEKII